VTSSWFLLSTLNYDARSTTHQIHNNYFDHDELLLGLYVF
jgi:hypothetical protein